MPVIPNGPKPPHDEGGDADSPASQPSPKARPKKKVAVGGIIGIGILVAMLLMIGIGAVFANQKRDVDVPDLRGMTTTQAKTALTSAGLKVGSYKYTYSTKVSKDLVIDSDPKRQVSVKEGSTVKLILSRGQPQFTLENYVGQDYTDVKSDLQKRGVTVKENRSAPMTNRQARSCHKALKQAKRSLRTKRRSHLVFPLRSSQILLRFVI